MNLNEYIEQLIKFRDENPKFSEMQVIYSIDAEGNAYHPVYYSPTAGHYNEEEQEWESIDNLNEENYDEEELLEKPINSVCIN